MLAAAGSSSSANARRTASGVSQAKPGPRACSQNRKGGSSEVTQSVAAAKVRGEGRLFGRIGVPLGRLDAHLLDPVPRRRRRQRGQPRIIGQQARLAARRARPAAAARRIRRSRPHARVHAAHQERYAVSSRGESARANSTSSDRAASSFSAGVSIHVFPYGPTIPRAEAIDDDNDAAAGGLDMEGRGEQGSRVRNHVSKIRPDSALVRR